MKRNIRLTAALAVARPRRQRSRMTPAPLDLFGQIPVSEADVDAWLRCVAQITADSPRREWYVRAYDVVNKVRQAKRSGRFALLTCGA